MPNRDLDRFFPVVPQNAPPDDLSNYLDLYAQEAGAFLSSQQANASNRAEWYVNTRMPVMRSLGDVHIEMGNVNVQTRRLQGLRGVGDALGLDPTASINDAAGFANVSTTWAQRAANAAGQNIAVDGVAGGQTLNALKAVRLAWLSRQPTPLSTRPAQIGVPSIVDTRHVLIPIDLYGYLSRLVQVADPARAPSSTPDATPFVAAATAGLGQLGTFAVVGALMLGGLVLMNPRLEEHPPRRARRGR